MKFRYCPGNYPTPMLAYYTEPNLEVFKEYLGAMSDTYNIIPKYIEGNKHYWNMNAYVIVNEQMNEVLSFSFIEFIYIIYLLRVINKELIINIDDVIYEANKSDFEALSTELVLIKE